MRLILIPFITVSLAACEPAPTNAPTDLPFFGDGYRFDGDACRRVGENAFTNPYLGDATDLIGCPETLNDLQDITDLNAQEVARKDGFVLYSVPRR